MSRLLWTVAVLAAAFAVLVAVLIADADGLNEPLFESAVAADGGAVLELSSEGSKDMHVRWLEYFVYGDLSSSNVLVYLHGAFTTGRGLKFVAPAGWKIVAPTFPGFGASTPLRLARDNELSMFELYARDVEKLLVRLKIACSRESSARCASHPNGVVVYGGSWGGSLAIAVAGRLASTQSVRVRGVLIGAPAMPATPTFEGYASATAQAANGFLQKYVIPSVLGPPVVKLVYRSIFWSSKEKIAEIFGEPADTPGLEYLVEGENFFFFRVNC